MPLTTNLCSFHLFPWAKKHTGLCFIDKTESQVNSPSKGYFLSTRIGLPGRWDNCSDGTTTLSCPVAGWWQERPENDKHSSKEWTMPLLFAWRRRPLVRDSFQVLSLGAQLTLFFLGHWQKRKSIWVYGPLKSEIVKCLKCQVISEVSGKRRRKGSLLPLNLSGSQRNIEVHG